MADTEQAQAHWSIKGLGGAVNLVSQHVVEGPPFDPERLQALREMASATMRLYALACSKYDQAKRSKNWPDIKHVPSQFMELFASMGGPPVIETESETHGEPTAASTGQAAV